MFNKVLVVNDNDILIFTAKRILQKSQCTEDVATASNGLAGIEIIEADLAEKGYAPELIILDLHMPIMDGWEFLETYKAKFAEKLPNTRIVILSASIDPHDSLELHKYPFVFNKIIDTINLPAVEKLQALYNESVGNQLYSSAYSNAI